jgi:DNA-binding XRE family transcriptional regulator
MTTRPKSLRRIIEKQLGPLSFSGFLRGARASLDLSQTDMAKLLGMSRSTLCDIEKGRHLVSASLASKIAKKLELPEFVAVMAALQDQVTKAKLNYTVKIA